MASIHRPGSEGITSKIDLGDGRIVEIRESTVEVVGSPNALRVLGPSEKRLVDQTVGLAFALYQAEARSSRIDLVARNLATKEWDDAAIAALVGLVADWMPQDPERAYYLLHLTYAVARRWGTFWKHGQVASILGNWLLGPLNRPQEAIPVFEDLEKIARILCSYFGSTDRTQALGQLARRGLEQAYAMDGRIGREPDVRPDWADQVWKAIQERSWVRVDDEMFGQSEAIAVGSFLASNHCEDISSRTQDYWATLLETGATNRGLAAAARPTAGYLPVVTLAEILLGIGADATALKLLEPMTLDWESLSLLMRTLIANRMAMIQERLRQFDLASRWLRCIRMEKLDELARHSITAQGEQLLYSILQARVSDSRGDSRGSHNWTGQAIHQLRELEARYVNPSRCREDDLRALYTAMVARIGRSYLDEEIVAERLSFRRSAGRKRIEE